MARKRQDVLLDEWGDPVAPGGFETPGSPKRPDPADFPREQDDWGDPEPLPAPARKRGRKWIPISAAILLVAIAAAVLLILKPGIISDLTGRPAAQQPAPTAPPPAVQTTPPAAQTTPPAAQTTSPAAQTTPPVTPTPPPVLTPTPTVQTTPSPTPPPPTVQTTPPPVQPILPPLETKTPSPVQTTPPAAASDPWYPKELRYSYQQLSEADRELYDLLYDGAMEYRTRIPLPPNRFTVKDVERIQLLMRNDCPELFHVNYYRYWYDENSSYAERCNPVYRMSRDEWITRSDSIHGIVDGLKKETAGAADEFDIEFAAYRYIIMHCRYIGNGDASQYADGVLVDGTAVCAGYSNALQLLLRSLGIECVRIISVPEEDHAWNRVRINGKWYNCDVTWDDSGDYVHTFTPGDNEFLAYLNLPDRLMTAHTPAGEEGITYPVCTSLDDNYAVREGIYLRPGLPDYGKALREQISVFTKKGMRKIIILVDDKAAYSRMDNQLNDFYIWRPGKDETCTLYIIGQ